MAGTERVLRRVFVPFAVLVGCVFTVSCGGSDAPAYAAFAHKCAAPAAGETQGTLNDEKIWLRAWTDDLYLWYREVPSYDARVQYAYQVLFGRAATVEELAVARQVLGSTPDEASWADLAHVLLCSNEFVFVD